jgi:hypothetical protein
MLMLAQQASCCCRCAHGRHSAPHWHSHCHGPHASLALLSRVSDPSVDVLLLLRRSTTAGLPAAPAGCAMPLPSGSWLPAPDFDLLVIWSALALRDDAPACIILAVVVCNRHLHKAGSTCTSSALISYQTIRTQHKSTVGKECGSNSCCAGSQVCRQHEWGSLLSSDAPASCTPALHRQKQTQNGHRGSHQHNIQAGKAALGATNTGHRRP